METMGKLLVGSCAELCEHLVNTLGSSEEVNKNKLRKWKLGTREIFVYNLPTSVRLNIIRKLHDLLCKKSQNFSVKGLKDVKLSTSRKSLVVNVSDKKPYWYRLGLVMSDASVLSRSSVLFSTTTPDTLDSIVYGFGRVIIYVPRMMLYKKTGRSVCVFNVLVHDSVADVARRLKGREVNVLRSVIGELRNNKEFIVQFLAGVIDGDGAIDRDSIRISVHKNDVLFDMITSILGDARYDEKRYLLRLSTKALRVRGILEHLTENIISSSKRSKIRKLASRTTRFRGYALKHPYVINDEIVLRIKNVLGDYEINLLKSLKSRKKSKYEYLYIPAAGVKQFTTYKLLQCALSKLGEILRLNVDLSQSVKLGKREVIIYSQNVVTLLKTLLRRL